MVMIMQEKATEKKELLSTAMERTSEWICSQEISSDVTVIAGGTSFSLHKFPLISKCGRLKKLVSESTEVDACVIELPDIPGGDEGFELAAKFCYGFNFEIGMDNIAMLRCAAEFLEMTEDHAVGNLVGRTESYLNEVALKSLTGAVSVLHSAENFIQIAEKVKLVSRCIDMIADIACKDSKFLASAGRGEGGGGGDGLSPHGVPHQKPIVDWWAEDMIVLRIDLFQRVLTSMMAKGFDQCALAPLLMLYTQNSLRGLDTFGKGRKKMEPKDKHEKRVILETIVNLLPREKNAMSVSFLSMLLRAAIYLETTVSCMLDLEKRMALQLGQAALDDLLIPSYSFNGDTLFNVETVQRIMTSYLQYDLEGKSFSFNPDEEFESPLQCEMERVGKLMESYLAEIASDRNLTISKFIGLAELIPERAKSTEDGMYRAIDIYLKAHPALSDTERKKVCSVMDCQKLSREACAHAAQNDRLPVQTVVQVLYHEQQRLRDVMDGRPISTGDSSSLLTNVNQTSSITTTHPPGTDELEILKRENQDLKMELLKTKMKLKEMEKSADLSEMSSPASSTPKPSPGRPPLPRKSFITSVSKTLVKLIRADDSKARNRPSKNRRHSIS